VRNQDELERIIGYIEANPVKAGLAEAPDKWRFSSAAAVCGSAPSVGSGMFRSCVVTVRLATPDASVSYMGEVGAAAPPNPRACPSSWRTVVSKFFREHGNQG
jgi:hypothetical protein